MLKIAAMFSSYHKFVGIAVLSFAISLVIIQIRREDSPDQRDVSAGTSVDASASPRIDAATITGVVAPTAIAASQLRAASPIGSKDELTGHCVQILDDAARFAMQERSAAASVQASELSEDQLEAELGKLQTNTRVGVLDDSLAAFLLGLSGHQSSIDPDGDAAFIDFAISGTNSNSSLQAWHVLRKCASSGHACPLISVEQSLLSLDHNNAEAWALVATLHYRRGDVSGALTAMQGAARAPKSTWYWTETVAAIERSLATQTNIPYRDRLGLAFSTAAAFPLDSALIKMCETESVTSPVWRKSCLDFSALRGEHNETTMARTTASTIRERVLTAVGDIEQAKAVAAESSRLRAEANLRNIELLRSRAGLQEALIESGPDQLYAYLRAIKQHGEGEGANVYFRQSVTPLLERAGLLERDGTRECVTQLLSPPR